MVAGEDHLQGDDAVELELAGPLDDAHAAAAQLSEDLVAGDGRAAGRGRRRAEDLLHGVAPVGPGWGLRSKDPFQLELESERLGQVGNRCWYSSSRGDSPTSARSAISL
jgi:hypothetical protein